MASAKRTVLTRREALFLSATAGFSVATANSALASDSIKTAAHQGPGDCSTPRSAVAKTQYGKVRGFVDGGVLTTWLGPTAGQKLHEKLEYAYRHAHVEAEVVPFIDDMARRYAWCDVLVCRSGAVTVAEIAAAGVASILFPLPWFVVDEQTANARFLADRGAGIALAQLETKPEQLAEILLGLDRDRLAEMARAARALGKPDATRKCADLCVELAHAA